ncbi:hypothetical protein LIX17_08035 [Mycobacterium avium subsp. hominissuis]|uniref:hypothetical protein n=1 Tax=Mycobacterium avium TaxID=1764 RepID=UPI0012DA316D|nr:hypothetical protein [Mycobacterium avium]MBG0727300.1 hypothetical protein [Mycobacterium avium]MCA2335947.1 hypothetical protein [Mycobacterium avium]MDV3219278.1 hypothetical protein [Mycobacterium avium]QLI58521.1 hypothetical protein KV38_26700 [Mycobacterium avium subsp. hominissuis]QXD07636.1 hypothetical protein BB735_008810 [Mycobacterium avium subsp. hominissuis]
MSALVTTQSEAMRRSGARDLRRDDAERSDDAAALVTCAVTMQSEAMRRSGARD